MAAYALEKSGNFRIGGWPICVAGIAMKHHGTRLQCVFKFFLAECYSLIVVVRAVDLKVQAITHNTSSYLLIAAGSSIIL
jgi:hypothetical protein